MAERGLARSRAVVGIVGIALAAYCGFVSSAQTWKPERNVEIVVSSGPGGAADRSARTRTRAR
jgi:tripartite-type tricarboxylate transporter receptor subunit TctC